VIATLLTGATIVDGTGRRRYSTDVGIVDDRIALIGDLQHRDAVRRIDCRGRVLAPGFLDACSHTDAGLLVDALSPSKLAQGVTTEIAGNCGVSRLCNWDEWANADGFLRLLERQHIGPNGATFVGLTDALRTDDATAAIREACESGAIGVSIDMRTASLTDAFDAMRAARSGGAARASIHLRDESHNIASALGEAIDCARRADVILHVSHLRIEGSAHAGGAERVLEQIDRARTSGAAITCDLYPYVTTSIELASLLPASLRARSDWREILADPETAAAVAMEMHARLGESSWHDVMLAEVGSERHLPWCGMRFDAIGRAARLSPPRAIIELLRDEGTAARAFFFTLHEADIETFLSADFLAIGSNAAAEPLAGATFGNPHPRAFGTFARVIGRFVRGRNALSLEEAVRRMTSLPASIFGIERRGEIAEGNHADLLLFDEATFVDTATYERAVSLPRGVERVWVNGVGVLEGGSFTNRRPGSVLRRGLP
jgi:N-acyl-D-amino-acid deacylase